MIKKNFKTLAAFAKKGLAIAAACAISLPAFAEGYQVNSQSARQEGMGHTGTALKLGAESHWGLGGSGSPLGLSGPAVW